MKKQLYVKDIRKGANFVDYFLVRSKQLNTGRTGQKYLSLELVDRTGVVDAKVWDNAESANASFETGDIVLVNAEAQVYNGQIQLRIFRIERADKAGFDLAEFVPSSSVPPEKMLEDLRNLLHLHVRDKHIRALIDQFFARTDLTKSFASAPGGKSVHHVYRGGLLEHTLSMARLAVAICNHYGARINKDLLLAGVLFHDIGKIRELSGEAAYEYTDEGRLLGHIAIGIEIVNDLISAIPDFPPAYALLIKHMIASHHNIAEFGAIKPPQTMEAMVLAYLDVLDARVQGFGAVFESLGDEEAWSGFLRIYDRHLLDWRRMAGLPTADDGQGSPQAGVVESSKKRENRREPLRARIEIPPEILERFGKKK